MSTLSRKALEHVADVVRPHITPFIAATGTISDEDLKELITFHTGQKIASELSLTVIHEAMCE